ncbi:MAG: O-antigen ligase family protein [Planctomycetaceae bacterium]
MCAAKRQPPSHPKKQRAKSPRANDSINKPSGWLTACVLALYFARFFIPTEGTETGETLWLTQCWLVLAVFWIIDTFRRGDVLWQRDRFDLAVGLLVGGHLVSGLFIVFGEGQKRAAINVMWEWIALGLVWVVMRRMLQSKNSSRRFLWSISSVAIALAGLGIYQHYIWHPQQAEWYRVRRAELDQLEKPVTGAVSGDALRKRQSRIRKLQAELRQAGIALNGPQRRRWEDRMQSSTEPFGKFGLANTFAGLLAVALLPLWSVLMSSARQPKRWRFLVGLACVTAIVAYCLLLTKSRTAWVGVLAGTGIWYWLSRKQLHDSIIRRKIWIAMAVAVLAAGVLFATLTGGLDRQIVSEAPKSLKYRLQYWSATFEMLKDHPLLGSGPGNFRQHYLKYKAAESSEEIRDPHNLLLDAWANGGILSLAGLCLLIGFGYHKLVVQTGLQNSPEVGAEHHSLNHVDSISSKLWMMGVAGSPLLIWMMGGFLDSTWDGELIILTMAIVVLLWATSRAYENWSCSSACLAGMWTVLLVHLLGAGGMEMPAVVQILLLLPMLKSFPQTEAEKAKSARTNRPDSLPSQTGQPLQEQHWKLVVGLTITITLSGLCIITATYPNQMRSWYLSAGDHAWGVQGRIDQAANFYREAAIADPFSPEPLERLAGISWRRWQFGGQREEDFQEAVQRQQDAIERNPNGSHAFVVLGEWYAEKYTLTKKREDALIAVSYFEKAIERYPTHSRNIAKFALLLNQMEKPPRSPEKVAEKALQLDDINIREGHADRVFEKPLRKTLETIRRKPSEDDSTGWRMDLKVVQQQIQWNSYPLFFSMFISKFSF